MSGDVPCVQEPCDCAQEAAILQNYGVQGGKARRAVGLPEFQNNIKEGDELGWQNIVKSL